jgi:hypothetical protein
LGPLHSTPIPCCQCLLICCHGNCPGASTSLQPTQQSAWGHKVGVGGLGHGDTLHETVSREKNIEVQSGLQEDVLLEHISASLRIVRLQKQAGGGHGRGICSGESGFWEGRGLVKCFDCFVCRVHGSQEDHGLDLGSFPWGRGP